MGAEVHGPHSLQKQLTDGPEELVRFCYEDRVADQVSMTQCLVVTRWTRST